MTVVGKCTISDCPAPELPCQKGEDECQSCPNFVLADVNKSKTPQKPVANMSNVGWSGNALKVTELSIITERNSPILLGIVGRVDAGKTSFLAMLYTLLLNGKHFKNFTFSGSKTILSWDELYHRLKFQKGSVPFPDPTPSGSNRIYHFALRDEQQRLKDLLFADASGETFSNWSVNRHDETAENARWIYSNSDAFLLFIDCDALCLGKNAARKDMMLIARQLTHDLRNRPVITVWSKSDKKSGIGKPLVDTLTTELKALFPIYNEVEISNFLHPGPDDLVHNNLAAVDWLLEEISSAKGISITIDTPPSEDSFINYRGK